MIDVDYEGKAYLRINMKVGDDLDLRDKLVKRFLTQIYTGGFLRLRPILHVNDDEQTHVVELLTPADLRDWMPTMEDLMKDHGLERRPNGADPAQIKEPIPEPDLSAIHPAFHDLIRHIMKMPPQRLMTLGQELDKELREG